MRRSTWLPLLLVLAAGAGVAFLFLGGSFGAAEDEAGEHEHAPGETVDGLVGPGGAALDPNNPTGPRRPRGPREEDEPDGPPKPTFPASEGISGRVVDANRAPVGDATVTLHPFPMESVWWGAPDAEPVAETKTAKDGTFLVGPGPKGRLKVRAVAPGFAPSVVPVAQRGARVELVLDKGGGLEVKVVDGKSAVVVDASVQHTAGSWGTQVITVAMTGKDGVAKFDALPTGSGNLMVSKPGLGAVRQQEVGVGVGIKTELTVVLQGGREITGLVTNGDDNRPVAGATIEIAYPYVPGIKPPAPVVSGEDGRYRTLVDIGQHEQFELRAKHPQFAELRAWLNYNDSGTGSMKHDVKLGQGSAGLTGRVLGKDGGSVSGATVTFGNQMPGQTLPSATTDGDGRFDLPAPLWATPGANLSVLAFSTGDGVGSTWAQLPQKSEARGKLVEIRLSGSGTIEGTVKDGSGSPAEGAAISVQLDWEAMNRQAQGSGRGVDWNIYSTLQDPKVATRLTAVTDTEGRFAITGVPAAFYQVSAAWSAFVATHDEAIEVKGGSQARVDLVLGEGMTISGTVLDTEERPVAGANVWAQMQENRPGMVQRWSTARSQSDGRFELRNVGTGTYTINANATGYGNDQAKNVTAGTRDVALKLKAQGWIEGQVLLDGEPVSGTFFVSATRKADGKGGDPTSYSMRGGMWEGGSNRSQNFNHPEGRFVLRGLMGGEYTLTANTPEGLVTLNAPSVTVSDGRGAGPVRLEFVRGAVVTGEVEAIDGKPIANAWLWFYAAQTQEGRTSPTGSARTDEKGAFIVRGLGVGAYSASVGSDTAVPWTETFDLQVGETKRVRFVEKQPGRVRFIVVDAQGSPLAKAQPMLTGAGGNQIWPNWNLMQRDGLLDPNAGDAWERITTTDASGACTRHHIPPGRYRASAALSGHVMSGEAQWVDVASNAITEVTITLGPAPAK
jgi:protocatechuate 3,4-dioxygenase beta subunit